MGNISNIIAKIESGEVDIKSALSDMQNKELSKEKVTDKVISDLKNASNEINLDHQRDQRCGFPEFVYGEGKTLNQLFQITKNISEQNKSVLITRISASSATKLLSDYPYAIYDKTANIFFLKAKEPNKKIKNNSKNTLNAIIITAGTTDLPVALEAKYTIEACGYSVDLLPDSGVAGIHRLLNHLPVLQSANAIIVVAGMEGALPSVVGGLVACPVIAVPTSVGYGTSLGGITAMFAMLNSCASGVTVMNIDNGFGAGCAVARILKQLNSLSCRDLSAYGVTRS